MNTLTKLLFFAVIVLSVVMLALKVSDLMTSVLSRSGGLLLVYAMFLL